MAYSLKTESAASTSPACASKSAYPRFSGSRSGFRFYSAELGRFLSRDPLTEKEEEQDLATIFPKLREPQGVSPTNRK